MGNRRFAKVALGAAGLFIALTLSLATMAQEQPSGGKPRSQPYNWKSVSFVGGGFVDGFVYHPTAKDVLYCRTDMGGAYRWDAGAKRWMPLLDWVPYADLNLMGVESIALDPSDAKRVYLACGTYTNPSTPNGAILRSDDSGKTFQRANVPFKFGGNENGRGNGERMSVDPNDGRVLYIGTRQAGLWRSTDRAATWTQVTTFPDTTEAPPPPPANTPPGSGGRFRPSRGSGIVFTLFDPRNKASSTIYVGVSLMGRDNLYRSTDNGASWQTLPGAPTQYRPNHAVLASDGNLYVSYGTDPGPNRMRDGGVWKFDTATGVWTDLTPEKPNPDEQAKAFGYAAVAVDAKHPQTIIASTFGHPGGEEIFRTTDGGKTWRPVIHPNGKYDYSRGPYVERTGIHWLFDIEIDPNNSDHALFTTGYGGHETFDLTDADRDQPTTWGVMSTGIEETVALDLLSPPSGAPLLTAIGDYGGSVFWDLDQPPAAGNYDKPHFGNTNSVACAWTQPDVIVRVGNGTGRNPNQNIGYSLDGGKTWQPTPAMPPAVSLPVPANVPAPPNGFPAQQPRVGTVAVSTDGATWVWTPERRNTYYTRDKGATWTAATGLPENTRVVADTVNPRKFYAIALFDGKFFTSTDGGATFAEQTLALPGGVPRLGGTGSNNQTNRGDNRGGQDKLYATPGREGDLWVAAFDGLYHSLDSGTTWAKRNGVQELHAFGFGKAAPKAELPALYLVGTVNGQRGFFRSDDTAQNWVRINDDQHQYGLVLQITGDPKRYGRVYVGTHGRGTLYADPK